jgi:hypothetical protein
MDLSEGIHLYRDNGPVIRSQFLFCNSTRLAPNRDLRALVNIYHWVAKKMNVWYEVVLL